MGKEKRKTRLEKGGGGAAEFIGFSAFAVPSTDSSSADGGTALKWSPVYTGSDATISLLFKKITQKRDGITKSKALNDLEDYFKKDDAVKKEQVAALSHLMFMFHSKLAYDDFATVRATALIALTAAYLRIPKAWTTLAMEQHHEIWGMVWCAQGDAAADVQIAARALCSHVHNGSFDGIHDYVKRILNYGRPKAMHDDLFARNNEVLSDMEREQLDERYERISTTAIEGMNLWIQNHPETEIFRYKIHFSDSFLFKPLNSSKSSFRRKTYQLISTMCQHAKSLVYSPVERSALSKILPQVVSQEKDPANVPIFIEFLLLYLSGNGDDFAVIIDAIYKPLSKMLKQACFGASANQWGPSMLPLFVTINDLEIVLPLIAYLWEGREAAIGPTDQLSIAAAVAESSSFFLLRRETDIEMEESKAKKLAALWLEVLLFFLSTSLHFFQGKEADRHLQICLARDCFRLDLASYNRDNCALHHIKDWFWVVQVPLVFESSTTSESHVRFNQLLEGVSAEEQRTGKNGKDMTRLHPIVRTKFHSVLASYQVTSGSVPNNNTYNFLIKSLNYCGAEYIFEIGGFTNINQFLMNDLLRWMVLHTSSLVDGYDKENMQLAEQDATLLAICLGAITSSLNQKSLWDAFLREITAAKCNLDILSACLVVLSNGFIDLIMSGALEEYAIQVGEDSARQRQILINKIVVNASVDVEPFKSSAPQTANFLRLCAGLHPSVPQCLIGKGAVEKWLEVATSAGERTENFNPSSSLPNPVLETMISIATKCDMMHSNDVLKVATEAWREGNLVWKQTGEILATNNEICKMLIAIGSAELSNGLKIICKSFSSLGRDEVLIWSTRARRLIDAHLTLGTSFSSLQLVGLSDFSLWQSVATGELDGNALFAILTSLLVILDSDVERRSLILEADGAFPGLFVNILLAMSDAGVYSSIYGSRKSEERCNFLLSFLGSAKDIGFGTIELWCTQVIEKLAIMMKSPCCDNGSQRNVTVLSVLLSMFLERMTIDGDFGLVEPTEVKEGQTLWYIQNDDERVRQEVTVKKVHRDDVPRLYFTISFECENGLQEKQTIPERLRTSSRLLTKASIPANEQSKRSKFALEIFEKVILPSLTVPMHIERMSITMAAAECMNIVISRCGIFGKGGIGTFRYNVFQMLQSLQEYAIQMLSAGCIDETCLALQALSRCMGHGGITPSRVNFDSTRFDPDNSVKAIIALLESKQRPPKLDRAVLEWLVVAIPGIEYPELRKEAFALELTCSSRLLSNTQSFERMQSLNLSDCLLTMKGQLDSIHMNLGDADSEVETVLCTEILRLFCDEWVVDDVNKWTDHDHSQVPIWHVPFRDFATTFIENGRDAIVKGARNNADSLISALTEPKKRWLAFMLLHSAAGMQIPLHDRDSLENVNDLTCVRLTCWKGELVVEEEAEEIEDDVVRVAQWLPPSLMNNVETWIESDLDFNSPSIDCTVIGRMLMWLTVLKCLESAATADLRNRGAFSSYVQKCNAVLFVLDMLLVYLPMNEKRQSKQSSAISMEDILLHEENIGIVKLSALALFRTVEVFPTLSKHWWEEDCPKSLSSAVSQFVQANVAPETLRRELRRIGAATNLGEMVVSGSIVSREVVARYTQDECQLSVAITLPPNFPLRNVEVDGRRTLGVPEKRWKRWALQIRLMLNSQDGTLLDALLLWKENVDKEFEGVEPCPVCYSVLSVKTHELPNLQCKTCEHRFHSSCLYKWFKSSGKSQCVLCQQPWSGSKLQQ